MSKSSTIRAKFRVHFVQEGRDADGNKGHETVHMSPVYSSDPNSENYAWSKATPGGNLSMTISNPSAFGILEQGKEYFLDFTPAS